MDPAKMKVVELREELQARGLNTKGVKADLVKRLKDALEKETQTSIPDTSILDTSTEMDTSQNEPEEDPLAADPVEEKKPDPKTQTTIKKEPPATPKKEVLSPKKEVLTPKKEVLSPKKEVVSPKKEVVTPKKQEKVTIENGEQDKAEAQNDAEGEKMEEETADGEAKGEKRKREDDSQENEKSQKRERERSPIREDEPEIDFSKTLLSWYDSDLLLQVDKENFLNAKPINEGAMGYIWNGVRATHGISNGKICYEVKLKEAMNWQDLTTKFTIPERPDNRYKKVKHDDKKKGDAEKKAEGKDKKDGEEKKDGEGEKMETDEASEKTESKEEAQPAETEKTDVKKDTEGKTEAESDDKKEAEENSAEGDTKKEEEAKKEEPPKEPIPTHLFRVGFSLGGTTLQLGEGKFSYGYESTGKFLTDKTITEYGITFGEGDVVGAFLSIDKNEVKITYTVNGAVQPVAITVPRSEFPENFVVYPHVSGRNFAFELNFGDQEEPWFPIPSELKEYQFLSKFPNRVSGPVRPDERKDCEIYLMVGLPASGKSNWVQEHIKGNPDKQYTVLGNHSLQEKMTVDCESIRQRFAGSWKILNDKLQKALNKLTDIAATRRRHFIIDQTNLFQAAQRRKMRAFEGYQRRAVVVVPDEEEQNRRLKQQQEQDGKSIPEQTIWELKAGMELPEKSDYLEEILWPELDEEKAKEVVKKYNEDAKAKGYSKRFPRRNHQRFGGQDRRGGQRGGWGSWGRQGGGWDRRDRGPPKQGGWGDHGSRNGRQGGGGGYGGGNRRQGEGGGWGGQRDSWGGRQGGSGGGWNQRMYAGYNKWQQEGWAGYGQGGWGGQGWGNQRGSGQEAQGGASRQNWNYYGQYGPQQGGWQQQY